MHLTQLRIFRAVAEAENYSRAAERLYFSQPYVYVQVRNLEKQLGCRLFDQVGRRAVLTEAGQVLFGYARQILSLEDEATRVIEDLNGLRWGHLELGGGPIVGNYILPLLVAEFKRRYPPIDITLQLYTPDADIAGKIDRFEVELVFLSVALQSPETILVEKIWQTEQVICVGEGHRLAQQEMVSPSDLANEVFIWFGHDTKTRQHGEAALRSLGLEPKSAMVLLSPEAVKQVVRAQYGVAILPRPAVAEELESRRLYALNVPGFKAELSIYSARHRSRRLSPAREAFLKLAREWIAPAAWHPAPSSSHL